MDLESFLNNYIGISGKKYSVVSYKEIPELKSTLDKFIGRNGGRIRHKACFSNAALMMKADPKIKYCEGYTGIKLGDSVLPIEHAWNEYEGKYFDITSELLFDNNLGKGTNEYIELYQTSDPEQANKAAEGIIRPFMKKNKK